jgi:uncharacterized surface protein with fasciclin (FAS1) repeats
MKIRNMLLFCLLFTACTKDDHALVVTAKPTIYEQIVKDPQLSLFKAALQRANMLSDSTFDSDGPFTVFAPVDSAFIAAGITADKINSLSPDSVAQLLQYHIVYGTLSSTSLIGFYARYVSAQNKTFSPMITKNYYGMFLNGIPLVQQDIPVGDGAMHKIGRVAIPPAGRVYTLIKENPDLTMYAEALHVLGYDTSLDKEKPVPQPYVQIPVPPTITVLAPNDEAFKAFGFADVAAIDQADPKILHDLVEWYFIQDSYYTCNFRGGLEIGIQPVYDPGYIGKGFQVLQDGITFRTTGNVIVPRIVQPDVVAVNGVIQIVDQVIVP